MIEKTEKAIIISIELGKLRIVGMRLAAIMEKGIDKNINKPVNIENKEG